MSNHRRREQLKAKRAEILSRAEIERLRDIDAEVWYAGAGELLLRLAWLPAFEPCVVWEVRSHNGALAAYRAQGRAPAERLVVGHQRLSVVEGALQAALDRLSAVSLSLTPAVTEAAVADGDEYVATVCSAFCTNCRISWIAGLHPIAWAATVEALLTVRALLESSPGDMDSSTPPSQIAHVCSRTTSVQLVRLSTGEFQVISPGEFGSLLCGFDYILANAAVAEALRTACGADVVLRDAKIVRKATGEVWSSYVEVIPGAEIKEPSELPLARLSPIRAWHYKGGNLFVNGNVRAALESLALADISFSAGFSQFA